MDAFTTNAGLIFTSLAAMNAAAAYTEPRSAWLFDGTSSGVYVLNPTTDTWTKVGRLPYDFVIGTDLGAGTADAIQITTDIPASDGVIVAFELFESTASSPVTVSINGGTALTLKTNRGNNASALTAGMDIWGRYRASDNTLRLLNDQDVSALLAQAEAAAAAAQAAANSNYTFDTVALAGAASIPDVVNAIIVRGRDTADDGVFSVYVDINNGSTDTFTSSGGDARTWYRVEEAPKFRYDIGLPWISTMGDLKARGMRPEWVDTLNEIGNDADAAIPIREMFAQGLGDGFNKFVFQNGRRYNADSWDPGDPTHAYAVLVTGLTQDVFIHAEGATIKGLPDIQEASNPGAIFRFESANVAANDSTFQRFVWRGGKFDASALPSASAGVTTVGGIALSGRLNIEFDSVFFDAGDLPPLGDIVGRGGGDQAIFATGFESYYSHGCGFRGWPDLAEYISNSQGKRSRHINNYYLWCENGIALKRFSSRALAALNRFVECGVGIYNPVADGLTNNHGGPIYIETNVFERCEIPVDIGGSSAGGSAVQTNKFLGWGRRASDGAEYTDPGQRYAVRLRVPNCIVSANLFDLAGETLTTTPGKEQIGIDFNFSGGDVNTGANDCQSYGNTFKDVYRAHNMGANTARIRRYLNKRVNVSQLDLDGGDNIFPYRLTDDTMATIVTPQNRSRVCIKSTTTGAGWPNGSLILNTTGAPAVPVYDPATGSTTGIALSNSVSSVAGAVDGSFTIATGIGVLYLINRTGGTVLVDLQWDQE
ncbi:hypothetical protein CN151_10605 [Sinorhizobium meliloti]|uniref:hypothetical protein n=1 Tax=Rhizobium meliloti TaxID=382 RepID=UPI000FD4EE9C|nr:hypothetical protein [Sinorhizobium meliloti]RVL05088.1 hypothetical protein CN151_10605 [Sinorhizobium meliloti]